MRPARAVSDPTGWDAALSDAERSLCRGLARETGAHVRHPSRRATRLFRVDLCRYGIRMTGSWLVCADRAIAALIGAWRLLVLPVTLLLFLHWPFRQVAPGYSAPPNHLPHR